MSRDDLCRFSQMTYVCEKSGCNREGGIFIFRHVKSDNSTSKSGQNYIYWFEPVSEPVSNHVFLFWWFGEPVARTSEK